MPQCVQLAEIKDITRVLSDGEHLPRWMKISSVRECKNQVYASFHKTTNEEVEQIFNSCGFKLNTLPYVRTSTTM